MAGRVSREAYESTGALRVAGKAGLGRSRPSIVNDKFLYHARNERLSCTNDGGTLKVVAIAGPDTPRLER